MSDDIFRKIGYGCPPKEYQFKKGQSGNPGGRPKGAKSANDVTIENLRKRMHVRINGQHVVCSALEVIIMALIKKASEGDIRAAKFLIDLLREAEEEKYYMETSANYLDKLITQGLNKAVYDAKAGNQDLTKARIFAEAALAKYNDELDAQEADGLPPTDDNSEQ
jgi:hypothetical protein